MKLKNKGEKYMINLKILQILAYIGMISIGVLGVWGLYMLIH